MTLTNFLVNIKKRFKPRIIVTHCAVLIYNQTILSILDYAASMIYSCIISDRNDFQLRIDTGGLGVIHGTCV